MIELYPEFYANSPEMAHHQGLLGSNIRAMQYIYDDLIEQIFVTTATWGLDIWEYLVGIDTDRSQSLQRRRENIIAKRRGAGTSTVEMIKNVAASYLNGTIDVEEDNANYAFKITCVGVEGIPEHTDDMLAAIEEIKPAHLGYSFTYGWLLIRDIHEVKTLAQMEAIEIKKFAGGRISTGGSIFG